MSRGLDSGNRYRIRPRPTCPTWPGKFRILVSFEYHRYKIGYSAATGHEKTFAETTRMSVHAFNAVVASHLREALAVCIVNRSISCAR